MRRTLAALVMMLALAAPALAQKDAPPDRIPLFIKATSATGFTDPSKDRQDSMKDLAGKLKDSKLIALVEKEEAAVIVLEVLARETKRETNGWTFATGQRQNKSVVTVRLSAGDFTTEFSGDGGSSGQFTGYRAAAGKVVKEIEDWVKKNREKLLTIGK